MTPVRLNPGAVIGVLGSGQLGRMFAIAARQMGFRVHTLSPDSDTPTGQVADREWNAGFDDLPTLTEFAKSVSVVTFEFENVPSASVDAVARLVPVRPAGTVLHTTQHRLREKTFLASAGFPVTPFRAVRALPELEKVLDEIGCPAVLKTAGFGYDGKGQRKISARSEAAGAFAELKGAEAILEAWVPFEKEISVVAARGADGGFAVYDVFENHHKNHILDVTVSPASIPEPVARVAQEMARGILGKLDVVGVMCVEMFLAPGGKLLVNELAPRPHNSGHLTIDACVTSQFEQQVRAVAGLPLGSTERLRPAAMANLLGEIWSEGEPHWDKALRIPGVRLHLYGKAEPRPGRKMGHLTALATTTDEARRRVLEARSLL